MNKRRITNKGLNQLLTLQDGTPLSNVPIEFLLVYENKVPASTLDAVSGDFIVGKRVQVVTGPDDDSGLLAGEVSADLWPTSRGTDPVFYLVNIPSLNMTFMAPLEDGEAPISWADFRLSGTLLSASPINNGAFISHLQDFSKHLTSDENDALDAANHPSAINPFATIGDIEFAGGHVHDNKSVLDDLSDVDGTLNYKGQPIRGGVGGSVSAITAAGGELVGAFLVEGVLEWRIIGEGSGQPDTFQAATGETLQAYVTNGDEGAKFVEWRTV